MKAQDNALILKYIDQYKEIAVQEMERSGIPASVTLAQAILESQAGQSRLALISNNHFGIKCKREWTGATVFEDDDARNECFRSYSTVLDSYRDHSDFLASRANYFFLFSIDPTDYKSWCYGLKKAGYATSSTYPEKLIGIIEKYHLTEVTGSTEVQVIPDTLIHHTAQADEDIDSPSHNDESKVNTELSKHINSQEAFSPSFDYPDDVFEINNTKVVLVKSGASLLAVASTHQLSYHQLLVNNEWVGKPDILPDDQLIYLERKAKTGATEFYQVKPGETLESISQSTAVRMESILEYNQFSVGSSPVVGSFIRLRPENKRLMFKR
jgi:LysM repeat protein